MSATHTEEAHTGPIKNPRQLLIAVFFSFVVPVFVIIGLVQYVSSADKSGAGASQTEMAKAQRLLANGSAAEEVLLQLARGLTNKLLHAPSVQLKKMSAAGRLDALAMAQELFALNEGADKNSQ